MIWLILLSFLIAALAPLLFPLLRQSTPWLAAMATAGLLGWFAAYLPAVLVGETFDMRWPWAADLGLELATRLDGLSLLFGLLITGIGSLICAYSAGYFHGSPRLGEFLGYLLLFLAAMLGLVLADNLLVLYVFWELTTISSYLLIGFSHEKKAARDAAFTGLVVTTAGGLALFGGLVLLGLTAGTFTISDLPGRAEAVAASGNYAAILVLILAGAVTKSAQVPFQFWLPAAMQAPTPVSAFLHSATMVKAGIYLLARLAPTLGQTTSWAVVVTTIGLLTTLVGGYLAARSDDLKQVLAYATISVLGGLTTLLGLGTPEAMVAAMTLLLGHALYKGTLFLVAGSVDHEAGLRDATRLGGLGRRMPLTATAAVLGGLSMIGFVPTLGFTAKEAWIKALEYAPAAAWLVTGVTVVAAVLLVTAAAVVCVGPFFRKTTSEAEHAHEAPFSMWAASLTLGLIGLGLGIAPHQTVAPLLEQAALAATPAGVASNVQVAADELPGPSSLAKGVNLTLALSIMSIVLGLALYWGREAWRQRDRIPEFANWVSPTAGFDLTIRGLNSAAKWQTAMLQSGLLTRYMAIILSTILTFIWLGLLTGESLTFGVDPSGFDFHELMIAVLTMAAAVGVIVAPSRQGVIVALGAVGYGIAVLFAIYSAPDLAMTQFGVETLTVILLVLAMARLPEMPSHRGWWQTAGRATLAIVAGVTMTTMLLVAQSYSPDVISEEYVARSLDEAYAENVVNAILVDFRALDTLGEITVLAVAGLGIWALMKHWPHREPRS